LIPIRGQTGLQGWADKIEDSVHQLETLTLAWYGGGERPDALLGSLLATCKARDVEVLWEHRPDPSTFLGTIETFFDLVPSSFIERAEA
jgi:hypothetical protein